VTRRYASSTEVPVDRSRTEIERILQRYGATGFMYATKRDKAMVAFEVNDRHLRMILPMPTEKDDAIRLNGWGYEKTEKQIQAALDQETRRRWRALALVIKAKLEAVQSGIAVFEDEFLAYFVLPSGVTMGEWARPQLEEASRTGRMPLLPTWAEGGK